jgi:hypothetical protein
MAVSFADGETPPVQEARRAAARRAKASFTQSE